MKDDDPSAWFVQNPLSAEDAAAYSEKRLEPAILKAVFEECQSILGDKPTFETMQAAVQRAILIAEEVWSDLEAESPTYDCRKGCSWCCHQTVMVTAPEVFVLKAYFENNRSVDELRSLAKSLATRTGEIAGLTTAQRQAGSLACGLLVDAACSGHLARPFPCRGAFSQDEAFCQALFEDFPGVLDDVMTGRRREPFLDVPKRLFNSAQFGMVAAMRELGYQCKPLELTAALSIALSRSNIVDEWLQDESVLADAELANVDGNYITKAI